MGTVRGQPGRWSRALVLALKIGTTAACIATFLPFAADFHWGADLFAHFRVQYLVALTLAAIILAWRRRFISAGFAAAGAVINLLFILPHAEALPVAAPAENAARLRCISLNVLQGNKNPAALEKFLRECNADVIVFQEVTPEIGQILRRLAPIYPGQYLRGRKDSKGAALLTRLPMRNGRFEPLPGQKTIGAVTAELTTPAGTFTIFGIHSHKPTDEKGAISQRAYFRWLAERCTETHARGTPVILAGDFNSTPWSRNLQQLVADSRLQDTSRGVLFGATWSYWLPHRLMIDHAFLTPEWQLLERKVGPAVGSDHRPLILDLTLRAR